MPAFAAIVHQCALAGVNINNPYVLLQRIKFVALIDDGMMFCVVSQYIHYHPFAGSNLFDLSAVLVEKIKMVVSVLLTLHYKFIRVPRNKADWVEWLHIFFISLSIEL